MSQTKRAAGSTSHSGGTTLSTEKDPLYDNPMANMRTGIRLNSEEGNMGECFAGPGDTYMPTKPKTLVSRPLPDFLDWVPALTGIPNSMPAIPMLGTLGWLLGAYAVAKSINYLDQEATSLQKEMQGEGEES